MPILVEYLASGDKIGQTLPIGPTQEVGYWLLIGIFTFDLSTF